MVFHFVYNILFIFFRFLPPSVPNLNIASDVIIDAFIIGVVTFVLNISQADSFARKHKYKINSNQELLAYGLCNIGCSFFSGFANAASLARCTVQDSAGGRTQV